MSSGNTSPAPTSSHVANDPFPPGVTSCADTIIVKPWIRCALLLRSLSDICRSSSIAPPRAEARDSPISADASAMGASGGNLISIELCGRL